MLDVMQDPAEPRGGVEEADALDALLQEWLAAPVETPTLLPPAARGQGNARRRTIARTSVPDTRSPERPSPAPVATARETEFADRDASTQNLPARTFGAEDMALFEQLTGYRLIQQQQLWRSVGKDGERPAAADRLFTVLAEETFVIADRQRRHGPFPQSDLTIGDIVAATKSIRSIALQLGERGARASDRWETVVLSHLNRQVAA
jgi:hypothetical protein